MGPRQRNNAIALAKREEAAKAITPFEAASATMQQRGERHLGCMANIVEKTMPHVEAMEPGAILDRVDDVEKLDKVARRTFGISDDGSHGENVTVNIGISGNRGHLAIRLRQSVAISRCNQRLRVRRERLA